MIGIIRNVLSFNPFLGTHLALLFQTIGLIFYILIPKDYLPKNSAAVRLYRLLKSFGLAIFFLFSIMFVDIAVMWLANAWTYADWRFQLPSVIIILVIGVEFLGYILLSRPRVVDLLYFAGSYALYAYYFHAYVSQFEVMSLYIEGKVMYIFGAIILVGIPVIYGRPDKSSNIHMENEKKVHAKSGSPWKRPLWDLEKYYHKIYQNWVIGLLWLLALLQSILTLNGYSLFFFF